ncbi:NAD(P)-dependent alcohol dehydrogenase [Promicromonospora sp. NPDC050880]|uniref:NAD(P)-dependent alcohol dehydrogenase n=1 Tax=Promicromonospora sp. NPDC050880 TaxID=3364406 RepID=UPI00378AA51B
MRAVRYEAYGPAEVLRTVEVEVPQVGRTDVEVTVGGASVSGAEIPVRSGNLRRVVRQRMPAGTGVDFAGTVTLVGPAVTRVSAGDTVWGVMPHLTFGAVAERVVVPQRCVAPAPSNVSEIEAAALASSGTTALHALIAKADLRPGQRLLVRGATGGVGVVAVQLGATLGAHVTALARADSLDWIRSLGADEALDYRTTRPEDLATFDVIVDLVGTELRAFRRRLVPKGVMVALALDSRRPIRSALAVAVDGLDRRTRLTAFSNDPTPADLDRLRGFVESGAIRPVVHDVLPMHEIVAAHHHLAQGGVRGKIVIDARSR